jgi:DNA-binding MarR family transcriptional regulator
MASSSPRDKDYEPEVLLYQTRDAMSKTRDKEVAKYGFSRMQIALLFVINYLGNKPTVSEIARCLLREPHSISGLVTRMEKKGLVRKVKDLHRKNLVRVAMTEKGRQAFHQTNKRESIHRIMSSLTKQERQRLTVSLRTLRDTALKEFGTDYRPPFP